MENKNQFHQNLKPNRFNSKISNGNKKDVFEMVEIPDADYDEEEISDNEYNNDEEYDVYADFDQIRPEDGFEITTDEPDLSPVRNRFKPNNSETYESLGKRPKLTIRNAKKIALQLGLLNKDQENHRNFINHGFETDSDNDRENSICNVEIPQRRQCWAKSCNKVNCKIHSFLNDMSSGDNQTIEFHHYRRKYQKINQLKDNLSEFWSSILIWSRDLRRIEASYGTGIVSYFHFLRWLLFVNVLIALSVILLIIVPQTSFTNYYENNANNSLTNYTSKSNHTESETAFEYVADFLMGTGFMNSTLLFIGNYERKVVRLPLLNWSYNITLAYLACTLVYFLFSFIIMLKYTTDGMRDSLSSDHHQQYSSMVFCGWDYCTQSKQRFDLKQKSIAMEVKNCQEIDLRKERALLRSSAEKAKLFIIRFSILVIVVIILTASLWAIVIVTQLSFSPENKIGFIKEYSPTLVIFALYLIVPEIFLYLVKYEKYDSPATDIKVTLVRMVFLRMSSVIVLLISLLNTISKNNFECWENYIGQSFYKLMIGDFMLDIFILLIADSLRKLAVSKISFVRKLLDYQRFDIPKSVLSLVYIQALCWLGTFYCPLMPIICILRLFVLFYAQKFTLLKNCSPPDQAYRASRSNIIFILILIISYFISAIPIAYSIGSSTRVPSHNCSPFAGYPYKWKPIEALIENSYDWLQAISDIVSSTASTLVISFFLCLLTYYYYIRGLMHKKMVDSVHQELKEIAADRIYLIDELSLLQIRQDLIKDSVRM